MFCSVCGAQAAGATGSCPSCGASLGQSGPAGIAPASPQVMVVKSGKSAGLAAVLSFFWCGLGQIYNGQIGKGVVLLIAYVISILLMFALIGFITTPILWVYGMVDSYRTADRLNRAAGLA
ncbi:MAG TPA: hypothetical protein VK066_05560 [Chloroflexota bacterium]|nr:hypothetical protein [Chloroflexota bacterium]